MTAAPCLVETESLGTPCTIGSFGEYRVAGLYCDREYFLLAWWRINPCCVEARLNTALNSTESPLYVLVALQFVKSYTDRGGRQDK